MEFLFNVHILYPVLVFKEKFFKFIISTLPISLDMTFFLKCYHFLSEYSASRIVLYTLYVLTHDPI